MTATQVEYWKYKETKRHNVASENLTSSQLVETKRHNVATENETFRHNVISEKLTATDIAEKIRHNQATEALTASDLAERARHNLATEHEAWRHNVQTENEIQRHNYATERIGNLQIQVDKERLANAIMATDENIRHNKAMETIDKAINKVKADNLKSQTQLNQARVYTEIINAISSFLGGAGKIAGALAAFA